MPNITLKLSDELEAKSKEEKLAAFEVEVDSFSKWLETVSDPRAQGPLSRPERTLVKTYLVQKYLGKLG